MGKPWPGKTLMILRKRREKMAKPYRVISIKQEVSLKKSKKKKSKPECKIKSYARIGALVGAIATSVLWGYEVKDKAMEILSSIGDWFLAK